MKPLIRKKLHTSQGASILMALLLFLTCSFVAAVVLGSAVSNAQKYKGQAQDQQAYLSVSSAAQMLQDIIGGCEMRGVEKKVIYQCRPEIEAAGLQAPDPPPHQDSFCRCAGLTITKPGPPGGNHLDDEFFKSIDCSPSPPSGGDGQIQNLLKEGAYEAYKSMTIYNEEEAFTGWSKELVIQAKHMDQVQVNLAMERDYKVTAVLKPLDGHGMALDRYGITLTFAAAPSSTVRTETLPDSHKGYVVRMNPDTGQEEKVDITLSLNYTIYTNVTTIAWSKGTIRKGA